MLTLDVAISTYNPDGILRVEKMLSHIPSQKGVKFIVSWQQHENAPIPVSLQERSDVEIFKFDLKGLSRNRNNCMEHCAGDIILIADDDLEYKTGFAKKIIKCFEEDPRLDVATFKTDRPDEKAYPLNKTRLCLPYPKNYYISSIEMAFRKDRIKDLRFWIEMGLGAEKMHCGEEELLLFQTIKRGLNCTYFPITICKHQGITTGNKITKEILRGQGFVITLMHPWSSILRMMLKAYSINRKEKYSFYKTLKYLTQGAMYSLKKRRQLLAWS